MPFRLSKRQFRLCPQRLNPSSNLSAELFSQKNATVGSGPCVLKLMVHCKASEPGNSITSFRSMEFMPKHPEGNTKQVSFISMFCVFSSVVPKKSEQNILRLVVPLNIKASVLALKPLNSFLLSFWFPLKVIL